MVTENSTLPIFIYREELVAAVRENQVVIVVGQTGSGKTTQLPQFLLDAGLAKGGRFGCTEPTRIATIAAATRIAEERNTILGQEIGYHVRFERKFSRNTKVKFATPGILLREAISDPDLSFYSGVIVDEAHDRDSFSDLLLGYLKRICQKRPEFRLVVTSATMDHREFQEYFDGAKVIHIPVREYPVDVKYQSVGYGRMIEEIVEWVKAVHTHNPSSGHILIFLPGEREIRKVVDQLIAMALPDIQILPLYGRLSSEQQRKVFLPCSERKVIVATNVAESSITIDGVSWVVDSGLAKIPGFDVGFGIPSLELQKISRGSASQRAGRAGRTGPGTCVRLYTENDFLSRPDHEEPEITRSDLSGLVLAMKSLNLGLEFDFLTKPPETLWKIAQEQLQWFGALDEQAQITEYGQQLADLPVDARLGQFVLGARHFGCVTEAVTIAAMLSIGIFFVSDFYSEAEVEEVKKRFVNKESDFLTLLNIWDAYQEAQFSDEWCVENRLNPYWMQGVRTIRAQLLDCFKQAGFPTPSSRNPELLGKAIHSAFRKNLLGQVDTGRRGTGRGSRHVYQSETGLLDVRIFFDSALTKQYPKPKYLVSFELKRVNRVYAHCNHQIPEEWVVDFGPAVSPQEVTATAEPQVEDSLLQGFLGKSIEEMKFSAKVLMKLWAIRIQTIQDLTQKSESQLFSELEREFPTRNSKGHVKTGFADLLQEVKQQLAHFDLKFKPEEHSAHGFAPDRFIPTLRPSSSLGDEAAAKVLGEQFPLFQQYRLATLEDEKIAARNAIALANLGLSRKQAQLMVPEMQLLEDPAFDFEDLYQEGCMGLLRAAELFDYTRGFRFSTFAYQWIKQFISRALAERSILPVHVIESISKFKVKYCTLEREIGCEPTREDMAESMGKTVQQVEGLYSLMLLHKHFVSLDKPTSEDEESASLGDFIVSENLSPLETVLETERDSEVVVKRILEEVPFLEVERECLELYFGLNGHRSHTLEEVGQTLGVTRERIRQRLERALGRLRTQKVWELARVAVPTLKAPPSSGEVKFSTVIGDSADEIEHVRKPREEGRTVQTPTEPVPWSIIGIVSHVAEQYGLSTQDLTGTAMFPTNIVRARQVAMYRLREELNLPFPEIGQLFTRSPETVTTSYGQIKTEVLEGKIPFGCFPTHPKELVPNPVDQKEVLQQDIAVLGLPPVTMQILRRRRRVNTLRGIVACGRDRLLMTEGMDEEAVQQIETALKNGGIELPSEGKEVL